MVTIHSIPLTNNNKMVFGEAGFVQFGEALRKLFNTCEYTNKDLAKVASYFWERINSFYKEQYKVMAYHRNSLECHSGKYKLRGFWIFAKTLEMHLFSPKSNFFHAMWQNLMPEHKLTWLLRDDNKPTVEEEMAKITHNTAKISKNTYVTSAHKNCTTCV